MAPKSLIFDVGNKNLGKVGNKIGNKMSNHVHFCFHVISLRTRRLNINFPA